MVVDYGGFFGFGEFEEGDGRAVGFGYVMGWVVVAEDVHDAGAGVDAVAAGVGFEG